ncbi:MAG: hypothetical protein LLG09_04880 [Negativicutes bacterium]|nr:hypothetical protein [Negativicutes bacterium]
MSELYEQTLSKSRSYSSDVEYKYSKIYWEIKNLAGQNPGLDLKQSENWDDEIVFLMSTYRELEKILLVDDSMKIIRIVPGEGNEELLNASASEINDSPSAIKIWQPLYAANELKGFVLGIVNSNYLISPVLVDIGTEYMLKITSGGNTVFESGGWAQRRSELTVNKDIALLNSEIWNASFAPTPELVSNKIAETKTVLYFGLLISLTTLVAVYLAQNYYKKSILLSIKQQELLIYQEELLVKQNVLLAANKELENFSYSVSHDLRAPLRHIIGFSELLAARLQGKLDEKSQHYLTVIMEAGNNMGGLIDNLLDFSNMGRMDLNNRRVNLNELLAKVIESFHAEVAGREIDWVLSDLPVVMADRNMLQLVLQNLLSNALKFTRYKTKARIEIGWSQDEMNSRYVVIYVKDNGVGFDMQFKDKLFTIFQRLHSAEEFEGTGVGLANVQRIIRRHGGRVWAEGMPDAGATFYFTLPKYERDLQS